jgi:heptose I phosphotransferase
MTLVRAATGFSWLCGIPLLRRLIQGQSWFAFAADWPAAVGPHWSQHIMSVPVSDRFHAKQGRSIGRWTVTSDTGRFLVVYLKRHYELPRWRGLFAVVCPSWAGSPGRLEWNHLAQAQSMGIPVPRAVAAGEWLRPWGRLQSFLAVEELTGMLPLHELIPLAAQRLSQRDFQTWKRGLLAELSRLTVLLHRQRFYHKDYYLCHFYASEADIATVPESWTGRLVMIDFHRLGNHRYLWPWYSIKDLAQLLYSSDVAGVTPRDRIRFWRGYRRGCWGQATRPLVWFRVAIVWKWKLYQRHRMRRLARTRRND